MGNTERRFVFVDALRGIAALAVVLDHVYAKNLASARTLPEPFHTLFENGGLGVYVFFALSGFVISHSVGEAKITPTYFGRFAIRRSLRLDPPYWASIALALLITVVANSILPGRAVPLPSAGAVGAHIVYLQALLGYEHILGVFWTLCYEIQFYLFYVACVGVAQRLAGKNDPGRWTFLTLAATAVVGVVVNSEVVPTLTISHAWGLRAWPCFVLGVAARAAATGRLSPRAFAALVVAALTASLVLASAVGEVIGIVATGLTAGALVVAGPNLTVWTLGRPLQLLGKISYALYLTHMISGSGTARIAMRVFGAAMTVPQLLASVTASVAVAVACAGLWYVLVEAPSHRLSRRVRLSPSARR